jgi:hypothetical protein
MGEASDRQRFLLESSQAIGVAAKPGSEHLDRDVALQPRVVRAVDRAHTAGSQQIGDMERAQPGSRCNGHSRESRKF